MNEMNDRIREVRQAVAQGWDLEQYREDIGIIALRYEELRAACAAVVFGSEVARPMFDPDD